MEFSYSAAYDYWHWSDRFRYRGVESVVRTGSGCEDEADAGSALARWKACAAKCADLCKSYFGGGLRGIVLRCQSAFGLARIVYAGQLSIHIHAVETTLTAFHDDRRNTWSD